MKLPRRQIVAGACLLALGGFSSSAFSQSVDELFDGAWRYQASCAGCHDSDGSGIYPFGPPLKGNAFVQNAPVPIVVQVIQNGRNYGERNHLAYVGMPAFHYIRGGEAIALVNYMKNGLQN